MSHPTSVVKSHAPLIRLVLYSLLGLWSSLLFIFCVVRLAYTLTPRSERSLMDGLPFYGVFDSHFGLYFIPHQPIPSSFIVGIYLCISPDPSVVELLVCSVLGFGFSMFMCGISWLPRQRGSINLFTGAPPSPPAKRRNIARVTGLKLAPSSSYGCFGLVEQAQRVYVYFISHQHVPPTCFGYSAAD
jgi:hypothetical protein